MNFRRRRPRVPRDLGGSWRADGLLKKEAAQHASEIPPHHRKRKRAPHTRRVRVRCWTCGFLLGFVDLKPRQYERDAISKKFGAWPTLCKGCRKKRR